MSLTRQQKEARVQETQTALAAAASVVFVTFDALTVDDMEELRETLHAHGARLRVMPKRLLKLVLRELKLDLDPQAQAGQLAVVWGSDAVMPAKTMHTFAKKHEQVQLVAGSLTGKLLSSAEVLALAVLPSREELLGQFVGTLAGPVRGLVLVLSGAQRQLVQALAAIAAKRKA